MPVIPNWLLNHPAGVAVQLHCWVHARLLLLPLLHLGLLILVPQPLQLLAYHVNLLNVVLLHIIASPLLELPEFTSFHVLCTFAVHDNRLVKLLIMKLVLLNEQATRVVLVFG